MLEDQIEKALLYDDAIKERRVRIISASNMHIKKKADSNARKRPASPTSISLDH